MDVKDVPKVTVATDTSAQSANSKSLQRTLNSLSAEKVDVSRSDSVVSEVDSQSNSTKETQAREKANSAINAINLVSEATEDIDSILQSIDGIAEQASNQSISEQRVAVLEEEAQQLVEEIKKRAQAEGPSGEKHLAGDEIKVELEEQLGKTLEVLLPDRAADGFGLAIKLSPADSIIQTRASIEEARRSLVELKDAVDRSKTEVEATVTELDVALQNTEAANPSIRDVDQALALTSELREGINEKPGQALNVANIDQQSLGLLK